MVGSPPAEPAEPPAEAGAGEQPGYSPEATLKELSALGEEQRTFSARSLLTALQTQLQTLHAFKALQQRQGQGGNELVAISEIIQLFLKNVYHLTSALPGTLMFDALEDLMGRSGLLQPFLGGIVQAGPTVLLKLGMPTEEALCDTHDELIRIAATAIVCYFHYTNFPSHPAQFPSDDACLLFTSLALKSCTHAASAAALEAQLAGAGGLISVAQIRWLMHFFRAKLAGLSADVYFSIGDKQHWTEQLAAQHADFLGLIKSVPENPAGYSPYVRTCLHFHQLPAAALFAQKGGVVAAQHRAHFYSAQLAAQRAIALALAGGGASSTAAAAAASPTTAAAAAAKPALCSASELRSLVAAARSGLAAELAVLPAVYGGLVALDPVDAGLLAGKVEPLVAGVPEGAEVLALTGQLYSMRAPTQLPRGAVAVDVGAQ